MNERGRAVRAMLAAAFIAVCAVGGYPLARLTGRPAWAQDPAPPPAAATGETDSTERDYSDELPRTPPKSPEEALGTFQLAAGFRIEQVAAEPLVTDPVALAFDARGRLFAVEMRGYSEDDQQVLGQIRLLQDDDGDGKFDRSTVYAQGLSWPTAVTCWDGGVLVGAAPDIYYFKDTDGDGVADVRRTVFTGFGRGNVQGLLNTFKWGLDNRIHGATSSSGGEVRTVESPAVPPLALRGRDFAIEPRTMQIEATSGGAQHGLSFDSWGTKFVCSNSDHLQQVLYEDRYLARNPYLAAPGPRLSIAADGPQADVFRTSPVEPWRIVRTRLRRKGIVRGPVERGGKAAGYFTGATGVTIYRGNAWPPAFRNWAIIGDVGSNLVHRKRLDDLGLRYSGQRVDEQAEFLTSTDLWFRPVQYANAPDGALYIADMYREVIEHPASLPPVIKRHLDLTSGRDRGRIYRIVPDRFQQPSLPRLDEASTEELARTLCHTNGWHRETAARLLYERQDRRAVAVLEAQVRQGEPAEGRIASLWALDGLDSLTPGVLLAALQDAEPHVRRHAVRLAEELAAGDPQLRSQLISLATDPDQRVRYQLAFSLGELPTSANRNQALATIARRDSAEPLIKLAVLSSLKTGAGDLLRLLVEGQDFVGSAAGQDWVASLAAQIGKQQRGADVAAVLALLRGHQQDAQLVAAIVRGLNAPAGSALAQQVTAASGGQSDKFLGELLDRARRQAADPQLDSAKRVEAVQLLRLGQFPTQRELLASLLAPELPGEVQAAAIETLAQFDDPAVADLLIDRWAGFSPSLRRQAGETLFSRSPWGHALLRAAEAGRVASSDLDPARLRLLLQQPPGELRQAAQRLLDQRLAARKEVLDLYAPALEKPGDAERGAAVFKKTCAACHRAAGMGHEIGPNLAAARNRGPDFILLNVLDPNREVNPQYLNYALTTTQGRVLTGMIAAETATSVELVRGENARDAVLRIEIDALKSTGTSLMPEGLEKQLDLQAMADLLAFLQQLE